MFIAICFFHNSLIIHDIIHEIVFEYFDFDFDVYFYTSFVKP